MYDINVIHVSLSEDGLGMFSSSSSPPPLLLQLPGFLELIVEHYRRCLIQIFGILEEYEVGFEGQRTLKEEVQKEPLTAVSESDRQSAEEQRIKRRSAEVRALLLPAPEEEDCKPIREEMGMKEHLDRADPGPQQASKYDKLPIKVEQKGEDWEALEEHWAGLDRPNGFISGLLHWKAGGGDSTTHIQTHFEPRTGGFTLPDPREREERMGGEDGSSSEAEGGETKELLRS